MSPNLTSEQPINTAVPRNHFDSSIYVDSEPSVVDSVEFKKKKGGVKLSNDIRHTNTGKSALLNHWIGFSKDSVERVKRGQSIIDIETVKNPAARVESRPSLWGLNVANESQKSQPDISKASLRTKLDQYYQRKVDE